MKNKGFAQQINKVRAQEQSLAKHKAFIIRQQTMDKAIMALGRIGIDPDTIVKFWETLMEVENDFNSAVCEDSEWDKSIEYAKVQIDREIKLYVPEDKFCPYEERYKYIDEIW